MLIQRLVYIILNVILVGIVNLGASHSNIDRPFTTSHQSFTLVNNLIVVEAEVSGQRGNFILDTGSSGLLLNQSHGQDLESDLELISASGESTALQKRFIKKFQFGSLIRRNFQALCTDLMHLESSLNIPLKGLIGMDVLSGADILIDFEGRIITIQPTKTKHFDADHRMSIDYQQGIPTIRAFFKGQELNLAIDLGASTSVLDESIAASLNLPFVEQVDLVTSSGPTQVANKVRCDAIQFGESLSFTTNAIVLDLSHLAKEQLHIDGVVGIDFIRSRQILISPSREQFYIWDK